VKYWQQCNKIVRYSTLELFPGLMTVSFRHLHSVVCLAVRSAQVSLLVFTLDLALEHDVSSHITYAITDLPRRLRGILVWRSLTLS
jgi:hypothetical protein